jgi:hypothetical protein
MTRITGPEARDAGSKFQCAPMRLAYGDTKASLAAGGGLTRKLISPE